MSQNEPKYVVTFDTAECEAGEQVVVILNPDTGQILHTSRSWEKTAIHFAVALRELRKVKNELAELTVKLPKTADGVTWVEGDLWFVIDGEVCPGFCRAFSCGHAQKRNGFCVTAHIIDGYSTREAAEQAAREAVNKTTCPRCGGDGWYYQNYADQMDDKPTQCDCPSEREAEKGKRK